MAIRFDMKSVDNCGESNFWEREREKKGEIVIINTVIVIIYIAIYISSMECEFPVFCACA